MKFSIKSGNPEKQRSGCVIVGVFESRKLPRSTALLDEAADGLISELMRRGDLSGKAGQSLLLHKLSGTQCERVLLVGLGKEKEFGEQAYGNALRLAVKALSDTGSHDASLFLTELPVKKRSLAWRVRQAATQAQDALYKFEQFKSEKSEKPHPLRELALMIEHREETGFAEEALEQGCAIADGMAWCRTLGNLPPNICHPTYLAEQAQALASEFKLECEILERSDMEQAGMQALLAVARGSHQPPKLITLHYRGAPPQEKPIVLVGKGITFDTGGISLKPGADMDEMKYDMCGAASVLGTLRSVAKLALPINLTVIVPASENMPGGSATRPGDIVTSLAGKTIEILNTDAEGRLILCDALTYAERFEPDTVIDVATLTGACVVALGHIATGLFANHSPLAHALQEAGESAVDRAWPMPLWDDYQDLLKSPFADMANIGGRWGGAITAACFLSRFTKQFEWAHLDIAGTAWTSGKDKGATGRPVPLLAHYLLRRAGKLH